MLLGGQLIHSLDSLFYSASECEWHMQLVRWEASFKTIVSRALQQTGRKVSELAFVITSTATANIMA